MIRTGVTLDKDQVMMNMAREHAMAKQGRKFINLRLLDFTKNRIQGGIVLHAQSYRDANGMPQFHFEERGGPIVFELDELQGAMFARVLDVEHNRRFLASMSSYPFWEIEDKTIEAEILEIAKGMTKKAIVQKKAVPKEEVLSDDQIEIEMARLQGEKSRRKLQQVEKDKPEHDVVEPKVSDVVEPEEPADIPENETTPDVPAEPPKEPQKRGRAAKRRLVSVE
jgi:hypothetical protein